MQYKQCAKCGKLIVYPMSYCNECAQKIRKEKIERQKESKKIYNRKHSRDRYQKDIRENQFYNSKDWKRIRDSKMQKAKYLCEECMKEGKITLAEEVHHIIPIKEDWSKRFDFDNLQCLCHKHHDKAHGRYQSK